MEHEIFIVIMSVVILAVLLLIAYLIYSNRFRKDDYGFTKKDYQKYKKTVKSPEAKQAFEELSQF